VAAVLVGAVLTLDLLWSLVEGSTGSLAYGLLDEPAHLATCAIALLAAAALTGARPPARFVTAALVAGVAIDIDHIPGYLGSHALAGSLPRPYTHSLLLVAVLVVIGWASRRRDVRQVSLGLAFGVSAHLLRDLATGPGVPLVWPLSSGVVAVPYASFAVALVLAGAAAIAPRRVPLAARLGLAAALAALLAVGAALVPAPAAARTVSIGAYISGADNNPSLIDNFDTQVGRQAAVILTYKDWSQAPFVGDQLDGIWNHGAVPMITWEPWGVSLKGIARGDYDGYVREAAQAAAGWGKPLMIRFAQEMNGDWFPWGGHPVAYKAAWRHLVRVFREAGADKVHWVWNPYVNSRGGRLPFTGYFPGGKWVDWVGLDAVNWGGAFPWRTFRQIIGRSYQQMTRLTRRPMIVAETGSGEEGGSKPHWVSRMLRHNVPRMGQVRALAFWSNNDPRGDLRVDSSSAALEALRSALGKPLYQSSRQSLLETPARLGR
jgi:membrane-bound metal-dependent hydrolase YbcI (DUF457 family)